jgi:hypothetical protein
LDWLEGELEAVNIGKTVTTRRLATLDSLIVQRVDRSAEPSAALRALVSRRRQMDTTNRRRAFSWSIAGIIRTTLRLAGDMGLQEYRRRLGENATEVAS